MSPIEEIKAQPDSIPPGTEGWWKVWGAQVRHIRPGDIVVSDNDQGGVDLDYIEDVYLAKNHPLRWGVIIDEQRLTFGALTPIRLFRRGTTNMLAD